MCTRSARFIALAIALGLGQSTVAQTYAIDKGSYAFGGAVSFTSQGTDSSALEDDGDRLTVGLLSTSFRYFVAPGFAVGAAVLSSTESQGDVTLTDFTIGPSLSVYFGSPESLAYPFLSGIIGFSSFAIEIDEVGSDSVNGALLGLEGGVSYLLARNIALTGSLFYQRQGFSDGGGSVTSNVFGFQGGVTAFIY